MIMKRAFLAAALQLVSSAVLCTFWSMFFEEGRMISAFPAVLLLYAPLTAFVDVLLLERRGPSTFLITADCVLAVIAFLSVLLFSSGQSLALKLLCLPFLFAYASYSVKIAADDIRYGTFLRLFDFSIVMFLIVSVYTQGRADADVLTYMALIALVVSLCAVLAIRHEGDNLSGWMSTAFPVAVVAAIIALLGGYAGVAGSSIITLWNGVRHLCYLAYSFILWLISLLPEAEAEPLGEIFLPSYDFTDRIGERGEMSQGGGVVFFIILVAAISVLSVVFLVLRARHTKPVRHSWHGKKKKVFSISIAKGLAKAISSISSYFRCKAYVFRNRNNSVGLYFWLCTALRRDIRHKRPGETPRQYLLRLSEIMPAFPLHELSNELDMVFYSPDKIIPGNVEKAYELRACIRHYKLTSKLKGVLSAISKKA